MNLRGLLVAALSGLALSLVLPAQALPSPVHWYRGDGDATDSIGGVHGTEMNGATYAPGLSGDAFQLDGIDDFVALPAAVSPTGSFTYEAWIRLDGAPPNAPFGIVSHVDGSTGAEIAVQFDRRVWGFVFGDVFVVGEILDFGTWYHIAMTVDTARSVAAFYMDGELTSTRPYTANPLSGFAPTIGTRQSPTGSPFFNGAIDEVKVYDRALTAAQVAAIHQVALGNPLLGPVDLELIDLDGDGLDDAVTANAATHDVSVWLNDGFGNLIAGARIALAGGEAPVDAALGDLDGNPATIDAAVACSESHTVALVIDLYGATPVVSALDCAGLRPVAVAVADLDGSGPDDVVVAREGLPLGGGAGLAVSLNGGAFVDVAVDRTREVVVADFDGDGNADIAALRAGSPDAIVLFAGDQAGGFVAAHSVIAPGTLPMMRGLALTDLGGDGDVDLVVTLANPLGPAGSAVVRMYPNSGAAPLGPANFGSFQQFVANADFVVGLALGDLDGTTFPGYADRVDLALVGLVPEFGVAAHEVWPAPSWIDPIAVPPGPSAIAIGNLNGDAAGDIVVVSEASSTFAITFGAVERISEVFGTGCPGTGSPTTPNVAPAITPLGAPWPGNTAFGRRLTNARALAPELSFFSFGNDETALGGGCTLYLAEPLASTLRFTDANGQDDYVFGVPSDAGLIGLEIFLQDAVFDPNGALFGVFAVSNAMRARIGPL